MRTALLIVALLGLSARALAGNKTMAQGGLAMDIQGKSGKMTIGRTDPPSKDPDKVTVLMDAMRELDSAGNTIGSKGKVKHSFNNFARTDFTFSDIVDTKLYGNLSAKEITFEAALLESAKVKVATYVMMESGNVTLGDEDNPLDIGNLKFTIQITDWPFCNGSVTNTDSTSYCKGQGNNPTEDGAFLEFDLTLKGKNPKPEKEDDDGSDDSAASGRYLKKSGSGSDASGSDSDGGGKMRKKPKKFKLGGAANLDLSTKVRVDGEWMDMPEGYPMITTKGSKTVFTFRYQRGQDIFYDPTVSFSTMDVPDDSESDSDSEDDSAAGAMGLAAAAAAVAFAAAAGTASA